MSTRKRSIRSLDFDPPSLTGVFTVLAAMGFEIEGDRLGLGTNLFSGEETLLEMLGYDYMQEELSKYSSYYIEKFE